MLPNIKPHCVYCNFQQISCNDMTTAFVNRRSLSLSSTKRFIEKTALYSMTTIPFHSTNKTKLSFPVPCPPGDNCAIRLWCSWRGMVVELPCSNILAGLISTAPWPLLRLSLAFLAGHRLPLQERLFPISVQCLTELWQTVIHAVVKDIPYCLSNRYQAACVQVMP
jgi:hypothetical protein